MENTLKLQRATVIAVDDPEGRGRVLLKTTLSSVEHWAFSASISQGHPSLKAQYQVGDQVLFIGDDHLSDTLILHLERAANIDDNIHDRPLKLSFSNGFDFELGNDPQGIILESNYGHSIRFLRNGGIVVQGNIINIEGGLINLSAQQLNITATTNIAGLVQCGTLIASNVVALNR